VLVFGDVLASAGLNALATSLGARRPGGPFAHLAVNGASHEEAAGGLVLDNSHVIDVLLSGRALLAAELGCHDDALVASSEAGTAALGAFGEFTVVGDDAVDGAGVSHALGSFLNVGALLAAELGLADDLAGALLGAGATGLGACRPGTEAGGAAVDGAFEAVAGLGLLECRASFAVEGSSNLNTTSAVLGSGGA